MKSMFTSILAYSLMVGVSVASPLAFGQNVNLTIRGVFYSPAGGVKCVGLPNQGLACSQSGEGVSDSLTATVSTSKGYLFTATAQGGTYPGVTLDGTCGNYLKGKVTYTNGVPTLSVLIPAGSIRNKAYSLNFKFIQYLPGIWRFQCQPT
jgi:hypothetical protein